MPSSYNLAIRDVIDGLLRWQVWTRLGWLEIRRRYRRTVIGPFWTALSISIFVIAVGLVFSTLWKMSLGQYLPFLCSGLIAWIFVSTIVTEGCTIFIVAEGLLKQFPFPLTTFACLNIWRNLVVFLHNLAVYAVVAVVFSVDVNARTLLLLPGLAVIVVNGIWISIIVGCLCARFRDVQPLISSLLQIIMLVTPIFWPPEQVGQWRTFIVEPNVVYHFVSVIRAPLLGHAPDALSWVVTVGCAIAGWVVTILVLARIRTRVIFWV